MSRAWRKKVVTPLFAKIIFFCIFQCIIILYMSFKNISCIFLSLTEKMYIAIRLYFK